MKKLMFVFVILGLLAQSCMRCKIDCPGPEEFVFVLVDEEGRNFFEDSRVVIQQVKVFKGSPTGEAVNLNSFGQGFFFFVPDQTAQSEYYIVVDNRASVQVVIEFTSRNSECCGEKLEITKVYLDGKEAIFSGGWVVVLENF